MLVTKDLGDSLTTTTGAKTAQGIGDLEDVYVSVGGAFGTGTATVEVSFDGTNYVVFDSTTSTGKLVGPLPNCKLVRGNTTAHSGTGTISYRMGGNKPRNAKFPVGETLAGAGTSIATGVADSGSIAVGGCGPAKVFLKSADWVGTYEVRCSFDGGTTWGVVNTATVANGATSAEVTCPRATHIKVYATTNTSGTLAVYYGARKEPQL